MAQVARDSQLHAKIDRYYLDYLLREWERVPTIAERWVTWQDHEQLNFVVEWPIREERLVQLEDWARRGLLTPEQQERYERLQELVARHRATLEKLLER